MADPITTAGGEGLAFDAASVSACGLVREENQDHCFCDLDHGIFCVADGMGGGQGGAMASEIVCRRLRESFASARDFADRLMHASEAITAAGREIRDYARTAGYRQMATTVATVFFEGGAEPFAFVGHVGDSRVYRYRDGCLLQLTVDHTVAETAKRNGAAGAMSTSLLDRLSHVLTRAVGVDIESRTDWRRTSVRAGDRFLLCSDGVYDMVSAADLAAAFAVGGTSAEIVARIEKLVLDAGAGDNYTMIVIGI